ncbi:hypothetical protein GO496_12245 [Acidovorax citrulli]|nr:hypothetical protein [Paracidovorax citrulli]
MREGEYLRQLAGHDETHWQQEILRLVEEGHAWADARDLLTRSEALSARRSRRATARADRQNRVATLEAALRGLEGRHQELRQGLRDQGAPAGAGAAHPVAGVPPPPVAPGRGLPALRLAGASCRRRLRSPGCVCDASPAGRRQAGPGSAGSRTPGARDRTGGVARAGGTGRGGRGRGRPRPGRRAVAMGGTVRSAGVARRPARWRRAGGGPAPACRVPGAGARAGGCAGRGAGQGRGGAAGRAAGRAGRPPPPGQALALADKDVQVAGRELQALDEALERQTAALQSVRQTLARDLAEQGIRPAAGARTLAARTRPRCAGLGGGLPAPAGPAGADAAAARGRRKRRLGGAAVDGAAGRTAGTGHAA